jgi:ubiquinone biosynthesis protein UbiJ
MIEHAFLAVLNHLLAGAPWARERLQPHAGLSARLDAAPVSILFTVSTAGILEATENQTPDVVLGIPLAALPQFAAGRFDEAMRAVHLQGNAEFADALGFVFRNLRWDAEEDLSRVIGDVAAHRLSGAVRAVGQAQRRMMEGVAGNLAEYLTEERPVLVSRPVATHFAADVRALRDAVARAEKRVVRLETRGREKS